MFSLQQCLDGALGALAAAAHEKGLELTCAISSELQETLEGDPVRLRQVIFNLVGNAVKFTDRGRVSLSVALESRAGSGQCLHFAVADTGIGIPEEKQKLIFEPFTQADGSSTRRHGGTGIGLSISAKLVEKMGGRIWVGSEPGHGSTFHFTACFGVLEN